MQISPFVVNSVFAVVIESAYSRMEGNSDGSTRVEDDLDDRTRVEKNLDGRTSVVDQS